MRNENLLKSCVSEIPVKQILLNQGVGVYTHLPPKFQYNTVYTARFAREEPMWNVDAHLDAKRETGSDL